MLKQKKGPAFLLKTFDMLEVQYELKVKKQQFKQIIDWTAEGTGFVVKNPSQLCEKVLPKYFKHSNMHSFIRQLNMYGFNKKRGSKVQNFYFHTLFKKGDRQAISEMQRKAQKKGAHRDQGIKQGANEEVSIELQQNSQQQCKVSNKKIKSEVLVQNEKKEPQADESKMLKSAIQLNSMNKILILEQIYHMANVSANNLLTYHLNLQQQNNSVSQQDCQQYQQTVQKFTITKDKYLKIMSIIWDKVNEKVQKYQSQGEMQMQRKQQQNIKEISANQNIHQYKQQQKYLKQTEISIQRLPSKLLSYNETIEPQKSIDNVSSLQLIQKNQIKNNKQQAKNIEAQ